MNRYILFLFFPFLLFSEQAIEVRLDTQAKLSPVYLSQFRVNKSSFDPEYIRKIHDVMAFDWKYSGLTSLLDEEKEKESKLQQPNIRYCFERSFWSSQPVDFVLLGEMNKDYLDLYFYNNKTNNMKRFKKIVLSGDLNKDRRKLHRFYDQLHEHLFHVRGVASKKILFSKRGLNRNKEWSSQIWVCDLDGGNSKQLTFDEGYAVCPCFLPSKEFMYVSYRSGQPKIQKASFQNSMGSAWISLRGNQLLPSTSPLGDTVAFVSDAAGRADLFIQSIDPQGQPKDKPRQIFSSPRSTQATSTFSPDGKKIAFVSDKDGPPRIYMIYIPDFSSHKRPPSHLITKKNRQNTSPAWSSNGTKLAYSAKTEGVRQIWIYDFDNGEEKQLTYGPNNKENPSWAPDSTHLIFNSEDGVVSEVFLTNIKDGKCVKITEGRFPTFEPH